MADGACSMACYRPIKGYRRPDGAVVFSGRGDLGQCEVPCGSCVGCRLERSRQWAVRCVHESKMHDSSSFVTLTYDDGNLPKGGSLNYVDYQLFMKRLRKEFSGKTVRFYMCGEYGEQTMRPHYHALLFGVDFVDKSKIGLASDGSDLFESHTLSRLWPHGISSFGAVTFQSASYVARYCMSKVTGSKADDFYKSVNVNTGEVFDRVPPFNKMSLKPGIGGTFLDKYFRDVYPKGYVVINGKKVKPPKYYDKLLKKVDEDTYDHIKFTRELLARERFEDNTDERLEVRGKVAQARVDLKSRNLE